MGFYSRPFASPDQMHAHELACLEEMAKANVGPAVPAVLRYCEQHHLVAPKWLLDAASDMLCRGLSGMKSPTRGRASGPLARYRQDLIDYARWDQVMVVREKQLEILKESQELQQLSAYSATGLRAEHEKMLRWIGRTLNRAFECAASLLQGTRAFGSPEAIKRSYFQVRKNQKNQTNGFRYHLLDPEFRDLLGSSVDVGRRVNSQTSPPYELK